MKTLAPIPPSGAVLLIALGLVAAALAADYSVTWWTTDGGGGTSTGGVYAVSGTLGQPDAGPTMTNGQYSVVGGFWSVAAVQTPGAPLLSLARTSTNTVVVWWPLPEAGWQLQATTNLVTTGSVWTPLPPPYATNATSLYIVEPLPVGNKFYRLQRP